MESGSERSDTVVASLGPSRDGRICDRDVMTWLPLELWEEVLGWGGPIGLGGEPDRVAAMRIQRRWRRLCGAHPEVRDVVDRDLPDVVEGTRIIFRRMRETQWRAGRIDCWRFPELESPLWLIVCVNTQGPVLTMFLPRDDLHVRHNNL